MNIKSMRGYIVPLATVFVLAVSTACPVQAVDSIAEIMAEDSETVIVGESDLMIEDASEAEDVIAEEPDSAFENAAETEEVTAEEPTLIIDASSDYESAIVEDPDSIADSTLEGDEVMESVGESDGSGTGTVGCCTGVCSGCAGRHASGLRISPVAAETQ